jgi:hypothetical protein
MESTGGGFCLFGTLPSKFVGEELQKRITPVF